MPVRNFTELAEVLPSFVLGFEALRTKSVRGTMSSEVTLCASDRI
jgi:hypothetical protein